MEVESGDHLMLARSVVAVVKCEAMVHVSVDITDTASLHSRLSAMARNLPPARVSPPPRLPLSASASIMSMSQNVNFTPPQVQPTMKRRLFCFIPHHQIVCDSANHVHTSLKREKKKKPRE